MKQLSGDCEVLQSTDQIMSPPSMPRTKTSLGTIVVDMGSRGDIDLRLKPNGMELYSPDKKALRPDPVSRIHCIPILMLLVFFILWVGSSVVPEVTSIANSTPGKDVTRMASSDKFIASEKQNVFIKENSQHDTMTVGQQDLLFHATDFANDQSKSSRAERTYMRGTAR
ncbi:uncharacterized protein [Physcomitrium patens]|uniref:Uncharacterized protein n=1 Tax=Physcomitrium patens TaxID=3218 RepID=A0A2K1JYF9_PHYPA|nr:uncharacterized protein LOC112288081 isoform X2 [Physcomitrium patens]PNR46567.1 hypothetical protein PHYPA_013686 [Physcomitrium patens]|eukprot:XP_024387689.1 uncharacterized protein LOC112288081 isoform X2 [Physcomitrella patens]